MAQGETSGRSGSGGDLRAQWLRGRPPGAVAQGETSGRSGSGGDLRAQWLRGRPPGAVAQGETSGLSTKRSRVRILCCGVKTLGKFFHSTLLQFTQLYKLVPGNRQWWICVRAAFRTLIVACGWMLPREVEMVFD